MESATIHLLQHCDWQFFLTMTFKSERMPQSIRLSMWWAFSRRVARTFHVYWPELLWALRIEEGEKTERLHFHALLGGLPRSVVCEKTCMWMGSVWARIGGGHFQARVFDPAADFAGYTIADMDLEGKNTYEGAKFSSVDSPVLLSRSIKTASESYLRRSSGVERRHKRANGGACVWQALDRAKITRPGEVGASESVHVDQPAGCGAVCHPRGGQGACGPQGKGVMQDRVNDPRGLAAETGPDRQL